MPSSEVGVIVIDTQELDDDLLGVRYAATALVTDLLSGRDGPHIKWSATTTYEVVPLETDYASGIVTGVEELARAMGFPDA